jgi:hypothetical protein
MVGHCSRHSLSFDLGRCKYFQNRTIPNFCTNSNNWALNVLPLLCPALNNVYMKMSGKNRRDQKVYINNAIRDDLLWALSHIKKSDGVHLLKSFSWTPSIADFVIYCDACLEGMGFWYPSSKEGFYAATSVQVPSNIIFFFKALCIISVIENVQS